MIAKLIKPWEDKTGAKVEHTIVPWNVEGATYATNYAGPNPFDVSYQTSTDLTGLGTKGVLEPLNTKQWLDNPNYASTKAKFIPNTITKSMYKGKLYGLPCIIGGTVIYYNKDLLGKAGIANIPRTEPELMAAAAKIAKLGNGTWGHNVSLSNKDFAWYFLYHGLHNRGMDIISKDQSKVTFNNPQAAAALQFYADMITNKVQPPVGQYDREAGVSLFKAGRIGFLHDEPLRLAVFRGEKLPFKWDFINPVGVGSKRTIFSTTGHWVMAVEGQEQGRRLGLREVPVLARVRERVRPALRLGARPQRRQHGQGPVHGQERRAGPADQRLRPEGLGRSAHRAEDGAAHGRLRSGDRGGGQRQDVGQGCARQGAGGRHRDPEELTGRDERNASEGGCRRKRQRRTGIS